MSWRPGVSPRFDRNGGPRPRLYLGMSIQALPGFRDFYPDELAIRSHVFGSMRRVALRYGFLEYDGPPLESLELYTQKSGDEIVGQLYHFRDKGEREVALRPEMTPTLARMVAPKASSMKKPIRWFSIPQLFRYERQQRGRLREHFQLNCDLIGEPGPAADAEIIALAIDVMRDLGLGPADIRVRVFDRRVLQALLESLGVPAEHLGVAYQAIDKIGRREFASHKEKLAQVAASVAALDFVERHRGVTRWAEMEALLAPYPAVLEAAAPLRATLAALEAMGLGDFVDLDLTIVRGLAYYTGTVFELFDAQGTFRAICGGGRYDNLLAALGGVDLPALGFGMGDVVLTELLRDRGLLPAPGPSAEVFLAAVTPEDRPFVLGLAHELRDSGFRVEYALVDQTVAKQFKLADARRVKVVIVVGPDDRARGEVVVKDLTAGAQRAVPWAGVVSALRALGAGPQP
ncbi:MAG: histidine--tRNA ligase [Gemmatimonadetes bacterium]|nr:histidine--tRNA ligase [Gemmatimonadota bacterium]